jgi:hypothetical protein
VRGAAVALADLRSGGGRVQSSYMQPYKIEKGIKVPPPARAISNGKSSRAALTMSKLEKGQSFLIKEIVEAMLAEKKMRDFMRRERERGGKRAFVSRRVGGGVRIWRVK